MPAASEVDSGTLFAPVVSRTLSWRWRFSSVWSFRVLDGETLPEDPKSMLNAAVADAVRAATPANSESRSGSKDDARPVSGGETISDSDLAELAIQTWRLQNRINGLDPVEHKRIRKSLTDSARRFSKILERFEVEFEDVTGQPYVRGWQEVEVVSWEEPGDETPPVDDGPWVKSTVSPIVRKQGRAMKLGQIVCVDVEG